MYSLPYRPRPEIQRVTAPSHKLYDWQRWCVDFYIPIGRPIIAARSGIVMLRESRWNSFFTDRRRNKTGNGLCIVHQDGQYSLY